jgi:hypothetical protein
MSHLIARPLGVLGLATIVILTAVAPAPRLAAAPPDDKGLASRLAVLEATVVAQAAQIVLLQGQVKQATAALVELQATTSSSDALEAKHRRQSDFGLQAAISALGDSEEVLSLALEDLYGKIQAVLQTNTGAIKAAHEAATIGALRTLASAETLFREADTDGNGVLDYTASLLALGRARFIDARLALGFKNGYHFAITSATETTWSATACPHVDASGEAAGDRSFFIDETGIIREATSCPAGPDSPPIGG